MVMSSCVEMIRLGDDAVLVLCWDGCVASFLVQWARSGSNRSCVVRVILFQRLDEYIVMRVR